MRGPKSSGATGCRFHSRASGAAICASARASLCVTWGARRKPGPASPANMSKRGLFARHYASNQTPRVVNARLPKGNLAAGNAGGTAGSGGFHGDEWSPLEVIRKRAKRPRRRPGPRAQLRTRPGRRKLFSRHHLPEVLQSTSPSEIRGRREDRVRAAPAVLRAIVATRVCTQAYRFGGGIRPSLRNGFTAYTISSW
jgi:hypothetical protein